MEWCLFPKGILISHSVEKPLLPYSTTDLSKTVKGQFASSTEFRSSYLPFFFFFFLWLTHTIEWRFHLIRMPLQLYWDNGDQNTFQSNILKANSMSVTYDMAQQLCFIWFNCGWKIWYFGHLYTTIPQLVTELHVLCVLWMWKYIPQYNASVSSLTPSTQGKCSSRTVCITLTGVTISSYFC